MKYILFNLYVSDDTILDTELTNTIFKTVAYNAKIKNKSTKVCLFSYVALPYLETELTEEDKSKILDFAGKHSVVKQRISNKELFEYNSLYSVLSPVANKRFTFDIITVFDTDKCDIFYSDGSSCKATGMASYATVKLLGNSYDPAALYDEFTMSDQLYEAYSNSIPDGTNNIGELTGVKTAIELAGNNEIQVIISDSEYSIKCFREWIHNWKTNGYKASNRKPILNCALIQSIQSEIENSKKIYLFKWTKGHANTPFNDVCDTLAKQELGI